MDPDICGSNIAHSIKQLIIKTFFGDNKLTVEQFVELKYQNEFGATESLPYHITYLIGKHIDPKEILKNSEEVLTGLSSTQIALLSCGQLTKNAPGFIKGEKNELLGHILNQDVPQEIQDFCIAELLSYKPNLAMEAIKQAGGAHFIGSHATGILAKSFTTPLNQLAPIVSYFSYRSQAFREATQKFNSYMGEKLTSKIQACITQLKAYRRDVFAISMSTARAERHLPKLPAEIVSIVASKKFSRNFESGVWHTFYPKNATANQNANSNLLGG
jgi:hypothetical protein